MARKILLADDSVTAQNMGRKILADAGYEVIAVNNGSAALKKIAELKPDLVILDVYMPGYSGLEVCQRLKESPETARIPVLLSVGKLEPFKPEESQRVRADGYIVKPFEASELLSALSKLEDKVVPRSEPSKPGRFARAVAAAEESGRGGRNATSNNEDGGWKSRIGFPHQKTDPQEPEKLADEATFYNPMNRDLRTVVEKPAPEVVGAKEKESERPQDAPVVEPVAEQNLDVAALAPTGFPKDVTPEELAAIAAAAAQIQMAAALDADQRASEVSFSEAAQAASATVAESVNQRYPIVTEALVASDEKNKIEGINSEVASAVLEYRRNGDQTPELQKSQVQSAEDAQDVPATLAASAESVVPSTSGSSRWTAVSVSLESDEAELSLAHEMQKAQSAFAAASSGLSASLPDMTVATPNESSFAPSSTASAVASVEISNPYRQLAPPPESASSPPPNATDPVQPLQLNPPQDALSLPASEPAPSSQPSAGGQPEATTGTPAGETDQRNNQAETFTNEESTAPAQELTSSVVEIQVAEPASSEPEIQEVADAASMQPPSVASPDHAVAAEPDSKVEPDSKLDRDTVKNTAAAWANWRQIRDTGKATEVPQVQPTEFDVPESPQPETNAKAVAAGAEQIILQAAAQSSNPSDVASIVDSVLADLRPKLMEEISRKMAEKK